MEGPFWVDARYHGDGRWTNTRSKREVRFEYFPDFDAHRAKEGEALIWDPKEGHLTAAHPGEKYRFICESRKLDGNLIIKIDKGGCHLSKCLHNLPRIRH